MAKARLRTSYALQGRCNPVQLSLSCNVPQEKLQSHTSTVIKQRLGGSLRSHHVLQEKLQSHTQSLSYNKDPMLR